MTAGTAHDPVAIAGSIPAYPENAPFDPGESYPEFGDRAVVGGPNAVFAAVRDAFRLLGLDPGRFGRADWNPLGEIVRPGDRVFIKPNLVTDRARAHADGRPGIFAVITHPSVVRAVADYAALALGGRGEIVIGDNPSIDASFEGILRQTRLDEVAAVYPRQFGITCRVLDLRPRWTIDLADYGFRSRTRPLPGDPEGTTRLDLGPQSFLEELDPRTFRGVFVKRGETVAEHSAGHHYYEFSSTIFRSDVYISIPKLKTHHKVGVTLNVKGLVGTISNKNGLVHWRVGTPEMGGDEFPPSTHPLDRALLGARHAVLDRAPEGAVRWLKRRLSGTRASLLLDETRSLSCEQHRGAWPGNDTCWRMAADLYLGLVRDVARRRHAPLRTLSVVDGVVGGEADGPFSPRERHAGVLVAGKDLLHVDAVAARLMGFDVGRIPHLDRLLARLGDAPGGAPLRSETVDVRDFYHDASPRLGFAPPTRWPHLCVAHSAALERSSA